MASFYYNRLATFRKVLDAEMKDATKCGIAQKCQMDSREEITEDEAKREFCGKKAFLEDIQLSH